MSNRNYVFTNSDLKTDFPFIIREVEKLHVNDPRGSVFRNAAQDLLFLNKANTLRFIKSIEDPIMMSYVMSSNCWTRFPSKTFLAALKKQIDKFQDNKSFYDNFLST
jgi:hypothetical protein